MKYWILTVAEINGEVLGHHIFKEKPWDGDPKFDQWMGTNYPESKNRDVVLAWSNNREIVEL